MTEVMTSGSGWMDGATTLTPGGSEEIMMDLGVRQAMKEWAAVQSKM